MFVFFNHPDFKQFFILMLHQSAPMLGSAYNLQVALERTAEESQKEKKLEKCWQHLFGVERSLASPSEAQFWVSLHLLSPLPLWKKRAGVVLTSGAATLFLLSLLRIASKCGVAIPDSSSGGWMKGTCGR